LWQSVFIQVFDIGTKTSFLSTTALHFLKERMKKTSGHDSHYLVSSLQQWISSRPYESQTLKTDLPKLGGEFSTRSTPPTGFFLLSCMWNKVNDPLSYIEIKNQSLPRSTYASHDSFDCVVYKRNTNGNYSKYAIENIASFIL